MKTNFKILATISLALLALVGCKRSDIGGGTPNGDYIISAVTDPPGSKVTVDGISVQWNETDYIYLFEIVDGQYKDGIRFNIIPESISPNGKDAKFSGQQLRNGATYAAFHFKSYQPMQELIYFLPYCMQPSAQDFSHIGENLLMKSSAEKIAAGFTPNFVFTHNMSILEMNFKLGSKIVGEHSLSRVELTAKDSSFVTSMVFHPKDQLSEVKSKSNLVGMEIQGGGLPLSKDKASTAKMFFIWDYENTNPSGNMTLTLTTTANEKCVVVKPAKAFKPGVLYTSAIEIDTLSKPITISERDVLMTLYNSTNGGNWKDNKNWGSDLPLNEWRGVFLNENGHVKILSLVNLGLDGTLPSELGQLRELEVLELPANNLYGEIPSSLGELSRLQRLLLSQNKLSGSIPEAILTLPDLLQLNLGLNQLTGSIPKGINQLKKLKILQLYSNQLSDSIPSSIGTMSNLETIQLSENKLSGSIPKTLGNLPNIEYLVLYSNQLEGSIPTQLGALNPKVIIDLSNNKLSGTLPVELANISEGSLYLGVNNLTGTIPAQYSNVPSLVVYQNKLSGTIPNVIKESDNWIRWEPLKYICPQQEGYGFTNCADVTTLLNQMYTIMSTFTTSNRHDSFGITDMFLALDYMGNDLIPNPSQWFSYEAQWRNDIRQVNGYQNRFFWALNYNIINYANAVIESYPDERSAVAEAKAVRAYCYFNLVRLYNKAYLHTSRGDISVPIVTRFNEIPTEYSNLGAVYDFILSDLDMAIEEAPMSNRLKYRVTKSVAKAIRAQLNLEMGNWYMAFMDAEAVRTSGQFSLMNKTEWESGFNTANREWIWGFTKPSLFELGYASFFSFADMAGGGYSTFFVNTAFIDTFSDEDYRNQWTQNSDSPQNWHYASSTKFRQQPGTFFYGDLSLIRLSEMQLISAEAQVRLGDLAHAASLVNSLRAERHAKTSNSDFSNTDNAMNAILLERRKEFFGEGIGIEWLDLKRNGKDMVRSGNHPFMFGVPANDSRWVLEMPQLNNGGNGDGILQDLKPEEWIKEKVKSKITPNR